MCAYLKTPYVAAIGFSWKWDLFIRTVTFSSQYKFKFRECRSLLTDMLMNLFYAFFYLSRIQIIFHWIDIEKFLKINTKHIARKWVRENNLINWSSVELMEHWICQIRNYLLYFEFNCFPLSIACEWRLVRELKNFQVP